MCGLAGFITKRKSDADCLESLVTRMALAIQHRGPDDSGAWVDAEAGIALGHRRLSIVDLSAAGHQPMVSTSGRFVLVFNGEIYNHLEIRKELERSVVGVTRHSGMDRRNPDCRDADNPCRNDGQDGMLETVAARPSEVPTLERWNHHSMGNQQEDHHPNPLPGGEGVRVQWRGYSDTETLLAAFEQWSVEATLKRTVGMFAIALWDRQTRTLHLARDRFGEKPLYYGWVGSGDSAAFVFGSELKALKAYPGFTNPVSRESLAQYMRFLYVPAPRSIYQHIYKLEPGCLLSINDTVPPVPSQPLRPPATYSGLRLQRWWSLSDVVEAGATHPITDEQEALTSLEKSLTEAVQLQSLADVPLGAFLSGGVDSSTIVALMQQQSTRAVKTFTVGFEEAGFDESPHALAVARHLGTDHTELFVTAKEAQGVILSLPVMYDEPFADSSQIPTHLVCRAARQQVTVALSGDAGDELFGGYNRYFWAPRIWNRLAWLPYPVRRVLGATIRSLPVAAWDTLSRPMNSLRPGSKGIAQMGDKAHKLAARLQHVRNLDDLYFSLVSEWQDPAQVVKLVDDDGWEGGIGNVELSRHTGMDCRYPEYREVNPVCPPWHLDSGNPPAIPDRGRLCRNDEINLNSTEIPPNPPFSKGGSFLMGLSGPLSDPLPSLGVEDSSLRMMYRDGISYLPDDILCKVDRAAMAIGLETRVPFLDHRVAELAWRLPLKMKIRGDQGKWALRQVLYHYVPRELIERPKAGFGIPVGQWLRGPLREWAESLLDESRILREGYFHPQPIREAWQQHLSGRYDWTLKLWSVLMFQAWLEANT